MIAVVAAVVVVGAIAFSKGVFTKTADEAAAEVAP